MPHPSTSFRSGDLLVLGGDEGGIGDQETSPKSAVLGGLMM